MDTYGLGRAGSDLVDGYMAFSDWGRQREGMDVRL